MLECDASQCRLRGDITLANAASLLEELKPRIAEKIPLLDFSGVAQVDSTALALILSCLRAAEHRNYRLRLTGCPASITTLADLYGVTPLINT